MKSKIAKFRGFCKSIRATLDQSGHSAKACIKLQNDYLDQKIAFITYSVWLQFGPKSVWKPEQTDYLFCIYQWL